MVLAAALSRLLPFLVCRQHKHVEKWINTTCWCCCCCRCKPVIVDNKWFNTVVLNKYTHIQRQTDWDSAKCPLETNHYSCVWAKEKAKGEARRITVSLTVANAVEACKNKQQHLKDRHLAPPAVNCWTGTVLPDNQTTSTSASGN